MNPVHCPGSCPRPLACRVGQTQACPQEPQGPWSRKTVLKINMLGSIAKYYISTSTIEHSYYARGMRTSRLHISMVPFAYLYPAALSLKDRLFESFWRFGSSLLEDHFFFFFLSLGRCLTIKENAEIISLIIYSKESNRYENQVGLDAFNSPLCVQHCSEPLHVQR